MDSIASYKGIHPTVADDVFVASTAAIVGDVHIGAGSSIWYGVVMRGDVNYIRIGSNTNIQDGSICHVTRKINPLIIGNDVTVGHAAVLHGCTLEDLSFVGMSATVMDGVVVESGAMVAAGALVTPNKRVKSGQLWAGSPAKYMRDLTLEESAFLKQSAINYYELSREYLSEN